MYLSQEACKDLGVIPRDFPKVGSCDKPFLCGMVSGEERVQVGKKNSAKVDPEEADTVVQESTPCVPDEVGGCKPGCFKTGERGSIAPRKFTKSQAI